MKNVVVFFFLCLSVSVFGQSNFSQYKYIVVPQKFQAFKKINQYQTSTQVKHLLKQKGFSVVYDATLPDDITFNRCLGLYLELNDESSMFTTKVTISFKDCYSKEVLLTPEGKSKNKDFKTAYTEAIKASLQYLDGSNYKYVETKKEVPMTISFKNDVKKIPKKNEDSPKKTILQTATVENQSYKNLEPKPSKLTKAKPNMVSLSNEVLYAQEIEGGYQLVDSSPKIRLKILKTSIDNVYTVKDATDNGVVLLKENQWYYEHYVSGKLVREKINIKF